MKITVFASLAVMLEALGQAENWQKLSVCVESAGVRQNEQVEIIASRIFEQAHVKLEWHMESRSCRYRPERVIEISLSTHTAADYMPAALAYALPYEGRHIVVFYDRIEYADPHLLPTLLAHIMAHEITHLLQGFSQHSEEGIMKARWGKGDYALMKLGALDFTPNDVRLIRDGLSGYERAQTRRVQLAAHQLVIALEIAGKLPD
jgi:hypothetical protein